MNFRVFRVAGNGPRCAYNGTSGWRAWEVACQHRALGRKVYVLCYGVTNHLLFPCGTAI